MDLGIEGKWALVCAASKGLGKGCAMALAPPSSMSGMRGPMVTIAAISSRPSAFPASMSVA
jgi:3-oxoacyl-[acyl-carrier protein] reductase